MNNRERKFVYKLAGYDKGIYMLELEEKIDRLEKRNKKLKQKNKRLNFIIDELEKEIKITIKKMSLKSSESSLIMKSSLEIILDRLKELKEEGKE